MQLPFIVATMTRRGLIRPGRPDRILGQLANLRAWGYTLTGELRASAARFPQRIALVDERGGITYQSLVQRTDRLAYTLASAAGIHPADRVGVLCRNHAGIVELMVALSTLGSDPVLINTGLSRPQLASVASQQRLRAVCYDDDAVDAVVDLAPAVLRLPWSMLDELVSTTPPGSAPRPGREGRVIVLTSGTTGTPKGAQRPTPSGLGALASILSRIPLDVGERMFISTPLFHTWGLAALQMSFALSATTILQRRFDPSATLAAIVQTGATALFAVPVMLQRLLDDVEPVPTSLRVVATSGSALPGPLAIRFMDAYGDVLYNLYGSTEVSWASIATPQELRTAPGTAGRPPRGTRVAILDADGAPVPVGQVGRIFVANSMLFDGYTGDALRDVHDGQLDTGDLGHLDEHGLLFVDGRADDMIVSGGENVFPLEVEHLLAALPEVREVAVVGVPDSQFGQRLAAYLVLTDGAVLDANAVRRHVRDHLARYSVPRDVHFVAELPRNATGKVVARELPRN